MLTLKRFATLAASYGADLDRWPEDIRGEANELLAASPEARALLEQARTLDTALVGNAVWQLGEQEAALVRLRIGVASRIADTAGLKPAQRPSWRLDLRWLGMAAGSGLAVAAGLAIGVLDVPAASSPDIVQIMFQPAPIDILAE